MWYWSQAGATLSPLTHKSSGEEAGFAAWVRRATEPRATGAERIDTTALPRPASLVVRAIAALIDVLIVVTIEVVVGSTWGTETEPLVWHTNGLAGCALTLLYPLYWLLPEAIAGGSVGKLVLGLRVFSIFGSTPSLLQIVKRNVAKLVELPILYAPSAIAARFSPLHQSMGDIWAGTFVTEATSIRRWRARGGTAVHDLDGIISRRSAGLGNQRRPTIV